MIKQILNRLPRNKVLSDGNDIQGRNVEAIFNSRNDRENSHANSKESLVITSALSLPLSDINISNGALKAAPVGVGIPESNSSLDCLPLFRDVSISERPNLFVSKLSLCSTTFDFRDPTKSWKEKDIKKQTLLELVDFISAGSLKITEQIIEEVTKMVAANLFRTLPPTIHENGHLEGFDVEDEEPTLEPAWPHLQVVYEFFFRFITLADIDPKIAKLYINQSFILKILELFDSEDSRERDSLKTILHRIYGKFKFHRPFIRRGMNNIFYCFVYETERHNGILELLEIWGSIINGFALPLKEEHKLVLERALIPLHKVKCVSLYHRQLCYCMNQFVEKDRKLADKVIRGLLKYWPTTNSRKEVMFLGELEEILEATQPDEFQQCMVPLFRWLACCLNSPHFLVAERALFLLNNDHIVDLVMPNRTVLLPIIFCALEENMNSHWNQVIHAMTMNARKLFMEMDQELFEDCKRRFKEEESSGAMLREEQTLIWQRLEVK